jgi:S1-C subfamily serine protease
MTFGISQTMKTNTTYGWLITQVTSGGPADDAGLKGGTKQVQIAGELVTVGGDIIVSIDNAKITNMDDLSTHLEEHTSPGQTISVTIERNNENLTLPLKLEARP